MESSVRGVDFLVCAMTAACAVCCVAGVWADEQTLTDDEVVVKTEGSHRLLLPKDWPIEQRDGQVGPVPIEAYLSMKFGQVREKFTATEQRVAALEQRVQQLEEDRKTLLIRLQRLEDHREP